MVAPRQRRALHPPPAAIDPRASTTTGEGLPHRNHHHPASSTSLPTTPSTTPTTISQNGSRRWKTRGRPRRRKSRLRQLLAWLCGEDPERWFVVTLVLLVVVLCLLCAMFVFTLFSTQEYSRSFASSMEVRLDLFYDPSDKEFFSDKNRNRLPVVVVGGTDGSGTRAFVDALAEIGVTVVYDDHQTFDIHASAMFQKQGWPAFVRAVLSETRSADYEWSGLPESTRYVVRREMKLLLEPIAKKYADTRRRQRQKRAETVVPMDPGEPPLPVPATPSFPAPGVAFAIKAPATMLLLPTLSEFMGPIRFLHVIRDGRDIALSDNQSPVLKFYNVTYGEEEAAKRAQQFKGDLYPVRAAQLWNDWNLQAHRWATSQNHHGRVGYLAVRSEDLLSNREGVLRALARFVDSPLDDNALCCLAAKKPKDFGVSAIHSETVNHGRSGRGDASEAHRQEIRQSYFREPRRRLDEEERAPRMVTSKFLQDYAKWKQQVEDLLSEEDPRPKTIDNFVKFGEVLRARRDRNQEYDANAAIDTTLYKLKQRFDELTAAEDGPEKAKRDVHARYGKRRPVDELQDAHDGPKKAKRDVHARYGKWRAALENRTELSGWLHREAAEALEAFGYEPFREWDYDYGNNASLVCTPEITCKAHGTTTRGGKNTKNHRRPKATKAERQTK